MTHETPKFIKTLVEGWPVYAVVGTFLLAFSELWIDRKVDDRIVAHETGKPSLTALDKKVGENGVQLGALSAGQLRIEGQLSILTEHLLENQ